MASMVGEGRGLARDGIEVGSFLSQTVSFIFALNESKFSDGSVRVKQMEDPVACRAWERG